MTYVSTASRVRKDLGAVVDGFEQLLRQLPVRRAECQSGGGIVIIVPPYYWGDISAEQRATQMTLKRRYEDVVELIRLLLRRAPETLVEQLHEADTQLRVWLELKDNWGLSGQASANERKFRSVAAPLEHILNVLDGVGSTELVVVPDTNSLLESADPTAYRAVAQQDTFTFMLVTTVLGELDRLKVAHNNPDVREKAKKVITRVKGWRNQGPLTGGVTVDKSITVRAHHSEPDMNNTLSWLDASVADDRIVATVLALQAEQPSARVLLVTADINLQNKADAARIQVAEL